MDRCTAIADVRVHFAEFFRFSFGFGAHKSNSFFFRDYAVPLEVYFNLIFYSEINPFVKVQEFLVSVFWGDGVYRFFWSLCSTLEVTPDRIIWLTSSACANCSHLCLQGRLQARSGKSNKSTKWWAVGRMAVPNSLTLCPSHQLSGFASQKYPLI